MPPFPIAHALLTEAIREHVFPGAAYGALLRGDVLASESVGRFTYEPDAPPILPDTIFDLASVSKVLATTATAMLLWQRGQLDLDLPIAVRLPRFVRTASPDSPRRFVTPRMLLAHSSGLPAYARLFERCHTAPELLNACLDMPLEALPDTQTVYSDIGFIILGHLLETIAAEPLDSFCRREIFAPLKMESTMYCPPAVLRPTIPPTAIENVLRWRMLQGEVHDDNCWVLGGVAGHAGVFSTVADTLRYAACILRHDDTVFQPEAISLFTTPPPPNTRNARALGWDVPTSPSSSGQFFSLHSVGHLGYTGTSLWIDCEKDLAVVLFTNRTFPGNVPDDSRKIQEVRPHFHDAVLRQLGFDAST